MSTLDLNNLSLEHLRSLKELSVSLRSEYHDLLNDIIRASDGGISWLVCSSASRDPYLNDLFRQFCLLVLATQLVEQNPGVDHVVTPTRGQAQALRRYFSGKGSCVRVSSTETRGQSIRAGLGVVWRRCLLLRNLVRMYRCKSLDRRESAPRNRPITLVDTFILSASKSAGKYVEPYYAGMLDQLSDQEKASIYFLPTMLERYDKSTFASFAEHSKENLIFKHDHLRLSDYLFALGSSLLRRRIDFGAFQFQGIEVADMLAAEFRRNRFHNSSILALLDYRFFRRLKLAGVQIRLAIDWFENQVIDRGFNKGLSDFYPETPRIGYQGFTLSTDVIHYIMPAEFETILGLTPGEFAVPGEKFVKQPRLFAKNLKVKVAPAFRAKSVWTELSGNGGEAAKRILVALPYTVSESCEIIKMLIEVNSLGGLDGVRLDVKPHPSMDMFQLKRQLNQPWPREFRVVGGDFQDCLAHASLLISSSSGACVETLTHGIPVVVIGSQVNLMQNPIPETIPEELWRMCCTPNELHIAIKKFQNINPDHRRQLVEIGRKVRADYFEPVTRAGVREFLRLAPSSSSNI